MSGSFQISLGIKFCYSKIFIDILFYKHRKYEININLTYQIGYIVKFVRVFYH